MSTTTDLFDMEADDASMKSLDNKSKVTDGIYRIDPKLAKDKAKGYVATIRFLPNLLTDGTLGLSAIEKGVHYAKLQDYPDLQGYYDSLTNHGEKCPLTTMYWKLKNSKNQAEVERAALISKTTKFYSYILVIEDEQQPELEGKILIYPYGFKIKNKINLERTGENSDGKKCNVFDPANGKDFRLIVKTVGEWPNYDSSMFRAISPLKIWDEDKSRFVEVPVTFDETKDKNVISNPKVQEKVINFLKSKTVNMDDHMAKPWSDEVRAKVDKIIDILSGRDVATARETIGRASNTTTSTPVSDTDFDDESDEEDDFFSDNK